MTPLEDHEVEIRRSLRMLHVAMVVVVAGIVLQFLAFVVSLAAFVLSQVAK